MWLYISFVKVDNYRWIIQGDIGSRICSWTKHYVIVQLCQCQVNTVSPSCAFIKHITVLCGAPRLYSRASECSPLPQTDNCLFHQRGGFSRSTTPAWTRADKPSTSSKIYFNITMLYSDLHIDCDELWTSIII